MWLGSGVRALGLGGGRILHPLLPRPLLAQPTRGRKRTNRLDRRLTTGLPKDRAALPARGQSRLKLKQRPWLLKLGVLRAQRRGRYFEPTGRSLLVGVA